jgi:hypothetical protein
MFFSALGRAVPIRDSFILVTDFAEPIPVEVTFTFWTTKSLTSDNREFLITLLAIFDLKM